MEEPGLYIGGGQQLSRNGGGSRWLRLLDIFDRFFMLFFTLLNTAVLFAGGALSAYGAYVMLASTETTVFGWALLAAASVLSMGSSRASC